ncbi:MAG: hypothetical protein KTR32_41530, partial [Granulosicoccus sp.]|nr:hypothetical protein [Granulosicoccus sp.]
MIRYVAVIDLGKTNSKVALVDTNEAKEICVIKQPTAVNSDSVEPDFYPALDHVAIREFVLESLAELSSMHALEAITVTTHGATVALIDAAGELAMPVLDYEYQSVDDTRTEYDKFRPDFSETGSPALPGGLNIGAQLFWQQRHHPELFLKVHTILTWPQYWIYMLTG